MRENHLDREKCEIILINKDFLFKWRNAVIVSSTTAILVSVSVLIAQQPALFAVAIFVGVFILVMAAIFVASDSWNERMIRQGFVANINEVMAPTQVSWLINIAYMAPWQKPISWNDVVEARVNSSLIGYGFTHTGSKSPGNGCVYRYIG